MGEWRFMHSHEHGQLTNRGGLPSTGVRSTVSRLPHKPACPTHLLGGARVPCAVSRASDPSSTPGTCGSSTEAALSFASFLPRRIIPASFLRQWQWQKSRLWKWVVDKNVHISSRCPCRVQSRTLTMRLLLCLMHVSFTLRACCYNTGSHRARISIVMTYIYH
jgi:hypothetical protein